MSTATAVDQRAAIIAALADNGTRAGRLRRIRESLATWPTIPAYVVVVNGVPLRADTAEQAVRLVHANPGLSHVIRVESL